MTKIFHKTATGMASYRRFIDENEHKVVKFVDCEDRIIVEVIPDVDENGTFVFISADF